MKRRFFAAFLSLCMTMTLVTATAWAAEPGDITDPHRIGNIGRGPNVYIYAEGPICCEGKSLSTGQPVASGQQSV